MPCPYIDECGYKPMSLTMKEINPEHHQDYCSDDAAYAGCCWFVNRLTTKEEKPSFEGSKEGLKQALMEAMSVTSEEAMYLIAIIKEHAFTIRNSTISGEEA